MMKNFKKWEKEVKQIVKQNKPIAVVNNKPCVCNPQCSQCRFNKNNGDMRGCVAKAFEWLYEEYKEPIKLTRLEYEMLKYLKRTGFEYLTNDYADSYVRVFNKKPKKGIVCWNVDRADYGNSYRLAAFDECFKFVKWGDKEPTLIQDILDNCEVVEDD